MKTLDTIIQDSLEDVFEFIRTGELSYNLISDLHMHYYDRLSFMAQRDSDDDGEIATFFEEDLKDLGYEFNN